MDMDSDLDEYFIDFHADIRQAEANLKYFAHAGTIAARVPLEKLDVKSVGTDFVDASQRIEKLRALLRRFNDDVKMVLDNSDVGSAKTLDDAKVALATSSPVPLKLTELESDAESSPPAPVTYSFPSIQPSISRSIESVYSFTSDVCNYRCGVYGNCEITHIIDSVECICCMVDFERNVSSELFERWLSESIPMDGLPLSNEIFGIEINSQIVRATCERQLIEIDQTAIQLIDIGKVIHVDSLRDQKMYHLTPAAKLTPVRANLCKIEKIGSMHTRAARIDVSSIMRRKFIFKVTNVCNAKRMLTVELFLTNPFVAECKDERRQSEQLQLQPYQHELLSLSSIGNENALTQNERMASAVADESALSSSLNGNYDNDITNASCVTKILSAPDRLPERWERQKQKPEQRQKLTHQQESHRKAFDAKIESMIENGISDANCNTGNTKRNDATVNGEHHRRNDDIACALDWHCNDCDNGTDDSDSSEDDSDDCVEDDNELAAGNTTNPTENGALIRALQRNFSPNKKQKNRQIDNNTDDTHKLLAKSNDLFAGAGACAGTIIDDENNNNANRYDCSALPPSMNVPPTMIQYMSARHQHALHHDTITIFPTCIVSVEQFYARLAEHYQSFSDFHAKLNAEFEANTLKRLSLIPDPWEMVLVVLHDGAVHRAKVLNNSPTAENRIEVFCLDSGLTRFASLDNIFHWSPLCCLMPFQAILCNVVNVRSRRADDAEAIGFMNAALLDRPVLAEVKALNTCGLTVRILNDDGYEFVDELVARNLATRCHRIDHNGNGKTKSLELHNDSPSP